MGKVEKLLVARGGSRLPTIRTLVDDESSSIPESRFTDCDFDRGYEVIRDKLEEDDIIRIDTIMSPDLGKQMPIPQDTVLVYGEAYAMANDKIIDDKYTIQDAFNDFAEQNNIAYHMASKRPSGEVDIKSLKDMF